MTIDEAKTTGSESVSNEGMHLNANAVDMGTCMFWVLTFRKGVHVIAAACLAAIQIPWLLGHNGEGWESEP